MCGAETLVVGLNAIDQFAWAGAHTWMVWRRYLAEFKREKGQEGEKTASKENGPHRRSKSKALEASRLCSP